MMSEISYCQLLLSLQLNQENFPSWETDTACEPRKI